MSEKNVIQAHSNLRPNSKFTMIGEKIVDWKDDENDPPSQEEIDVEVKRIEAEFEAQAYARQRAVAYPSVGDQLDMIYKDMKNSTTTHAEAVEAVKTKFPKE